MSHVARSGVALAAVLATLAVATPPAGAVGAITQFAGTSGCFLTGGLGGVCTPAAGVTGTESVAISPDGATVYSYDYGSGAVAVFARDPLTGNLSQLAGLAACVSLSGQDGQGHTVCADTRGPGAFGDLRSVAVSPDGRFLFVAGQSPDMVSVYSRDTSTGALTQLAGAAGCVSKNGTDGDGGSTCLAYNPLLSLSSVVVSPDGKTLYVSMRNTNKGLAVFSIAADGSLAPVQCVNGVAGGGCTVATGISSPGAAVVSPDGKNVYAAALTGNGIWAFTRDATTGVLTQLASTQGCITPDGSSGACTNGRAVGRAYALAISPDGTTLYEASNGGFGVGGAGGALTVFARDPSTGALTQLAGTDGCLTTNGASEDGADTCANARAIGDSYELAVSPDGRSVYNASYTGTAGGHEGFAIFDRASNGALTQLAGTAGCVTKDGTSEDGAATCATGHGISGPTAVVVSPDGANVYGGADGDGTLVAFSRATSSKPTCSATTADAGHDAAVVVSLACTATDGDALTRAIASGPSHGTLGAIDQSAGTVTFTPTAGYAGDDAFTFTATDRDGTSAPATATVHVAAAPATTNTTNPPPVITADSTPPVGRLGRIVARLRTLAKTGKLVIPVTSNEAGSVTVDLLVARTDAKHGHLAAARTVRIGRGSRRISAAGTVKVTVKLTKKARRAIGKLRKLKVTARATLKDAAGNKRTVRRSKTLTH